MPHPSSTLQRPTAKLLNRFAAWQLKDDTVRLYLDKGYSLAICCKDCPRLVEWTPPELAERFSGKLDLRLADLLPRLTCAGPDGCGSRDIALFPHL